MLFRKRINPIRPVRAASSKSPMFRVPVEGASKIAPGFYQGPDDITKAGLLNRGAFYRYIRDSIPIVGAAHWAWVKLCNTPNIIKFDGAEEAAKKATDELRRRILENPYSFGDSMNILSEMIFSELFLCGRYLAEIVTLPDGGVDYLKSLDSFKLKFERKERWAGYYGLEGQTKKLLDPEKVIYLCLSNDSVNPLGIEPLGSIPFVLQIEQQFLADMAKSSHNAGYPRLQISITPPAAWDNEEAEAYTARINKYFDDTVDVFSELDVDKNIFTWNDVEVKIVGGDQGRTWTWKIHREQIIEDVITGMKLFPWVLGRSHGTTKEWVRSQYNLLMQVVDSVQANAAEALQTILNMNLAGQDIKSQARFSFEPNKDPFETERENAFDRRIENVKKLLGMKAIEEEEAKLYLRARWNKY